VSAPGRAPGADQIHALRRMKLIAGALLGVAALAFALSTVVGHGEGWWGLLQTASEAAMVGGLADWFAVTALFRRPLGLPIPHTAIIPRKKDQIGASLGTFVRENFLVGDVVARHLAGLDAPRRLGLWLADPARAQRLARDAGAGLVNVAGMLRDEQIGPPVSAFAQDRLRDVPAAPIVARALEAALDGGQHQLALTSVVRSLGGFLEDNREVLRAQLDGELPTWLPKWADKRIFARIYSGLQDFLAQIADDPDHELRVLYDARLRDYVAALRDDPAAVERLEAVKAQLLDHPAVRDWTGSLWGSLKKSLLAAAQQDDSQLHRALAGLIVQGGRALAADERLQARLERLGERAIVQLLGRYGDDIAAVITTTVERWDAAETGRRLELQVGRDLQFIRINGTVVGALVGVLIHVVAVLAG